MKSHIITPRQTEGPFYPDVLPPDTDNDLLVINDSSGLADGEIVHLQGVVRDSNGDPVENASVEIWQTDNNMIYIHTGCPGQEKRDKNFQGFGRFITGPSGQYYFRTIKPLPYTLGGVTRAPHIHFIVRVGGKRMLTTQVFIKGHELNDTDMLLMEIRDREAREALQPEYLPKNGKMDEFSVTFDIVLDEQPEDPSWDIYKHMDGSLSE